MLFRHFFAEFDRFLRRCQIGLVHRDFQLVLACILFLQLRGQFRYGFLVGRVSESQADAMRSKLTSASCTYSIKTSALRFNL